MQFLVFSSPRRLPQMTDTATEARAIFDAMQIAKPALSHFSAGGQTTNSTAALMSIPVKQVFTERIHSPERIQERVNSFIDECLDPLDRRVEQSSPVGRDFARKGHRDCNKEQPGEQFLSKMDRLKFSIFPS